MRITRMSIYAMLLSALALSGCGSNENKPLKYMAVQIDKGSNWSIVDDKGEIVADEEYNPDDKISWINDGVYWVKSDDKYTLYNVKDPKKPVVDQTWKQATMMISGRAAVANPGETIKLINEKGEVTADLGENIREIEGFSFDKLAVYQDGKSGKYGYIDINGKIAIEAKYDAAFTFYENRALVVIENKKGDKDFGIFKIINTSGKELCSFRSDKYMPTATVMTENLLPVYRRDAEKPHLEYMNDKGEIVLTINKAVVKKRVNYSFNKGYAVFTDEDGKYGLIDKNGEIVIRAKYNNLIPLLGKRFAAEKNNKCGIIDCEDNTLIDFDYDGIMPNVIGDNIIAKNDKHYEVINSEGKSAFKDDFTDISLFECDYKVTFVNTKAIMSTVADLVNADNFAGVKAADGPEVVAKKLDANATAEDYKYKSSISGELTVANQDIRVNAVFTPAESPVKVLSHQERVGSGYWTYNKTVIDGYEFVQSPIIHARATISFYDDNIDPKMIAEGIGNAIRAKGFNLSGGIDSETEKVYTFTTKDNIVTDVTVTSSKYNVTIDYAYPEQRKEE